MQQVWEYEEMPEQLHPRAEVHSPEQGSNEATVQYSSFPAQLLVKEMHSQYVVKTLVMEVRWWVR